MRPRLALLFVGSAILAIALALLYSCYFPDVLPFASTDTRWFWRLDAAFVVSTITWTVAFVSAAAGLALLLLTVTRRSPKFEGR
ncbi:hypothetical protein JQ615_06345 [Bradyrhizobium jicamae]|uniref:Transmembrane protein n=1 Tax=Bradyrhizobium jicamae TaxID=280332 RepID=A0ABS5FF80_9BRAD|nr:hypothetical protein [Bradyrhizobium jicamae]MBR0795001.1 hypothetical protein [Bradyrhizobium jicamae]